MYNDTFLFSSSFSFVDKFSIQRHKLTVVLEDGINGVEKKGAVKIVRWSKWNQSDGRSHVIIPENSMVEEELRSLFSGWKGRKAKINVNVVGAQTKQKKVVLFNTRANMFVCVYVI